MDGEIIEEDIFRIIFDFRGRFSPIFGTILVVFDLLLETITRISIIKEGKESQYL